MSGHWFKPPPVPEDPSILDRFRYSPYFLRIATHEAGHAVVWHRFGYCVHWLGLVFNGDDIGQGLFVTAEDVAGAETKIGPERDRLRHAHVVMSLAGEAADLELFAKRCGYYDRDYHLAAIFARSPSTDPNVYPDLTPYKDEARRMVRENRAVIEAIGRCVMQSRTLSLSGDAFAELVAECDRLQAVQGS